uniref:rhomboid family intramembrane serine protease n=1 Tax=Ningiella ruwaisensis TaxID=2364274 RepID=UPI0010A05CFA|nr:rhomboid family intramembrane serine protease [Ningiella ruwaisensis]
MYEKRPFYRSPLIIVGLLGGLLLAIEIVNFLSGRQLTNLGIVPRHLDYIWHIFTAPFVHADFSHFLSNLLPICLFALLILQFGVKQFYLLTAGVLILTGVAVWLFARPAIHVGASGLVYGYLGYLVLAGWLSRKFSLIFISLAVTLLYGSMIFGALPVRGFISWESHLFGFISGLFMAYWMRRIR